MNVFKFLVKNTSALTASGCRSRKLRSPVREGSACAINALAVLYVISFPFIHTRLYTHVHIYTSFIVNNKAATPF